METTRFADLVRDATIDDAAFRQDMRRLTPADRCYVVLFSARSGSSWLTSLLSATGVMGFPHEYLNDSFVAGIARSLNAAAPRHLLQMLLRHNKTANNVFGLEARACDVRMLGVAPFRAALADRAIFFHLWRDNLVAQAVSLYRAVATDRYHSNSAGGSVAPPAYDAAEIERWLRHVAGTENDNAAMLRQLGVPARHLRYEDIVADRAATLAVFAQALGVSLLPDTLAAPAPAELTRLADDWNAHAEQRFHHDRADLIAAVQAARAVKHGLPGADPTPPVQAALHHAWESGRTAGAAGNSPFDPPSLPPLAATAWRDGWEAGWNTQPSVPDTLAAPAPDAPALPPPALPPPTLPPDIADTLLRSIRRQLPRALHDYTALRLIELLAEQARLGVAGGLLEIGLSRGRQTALLLAAPRETSIRVVGLDLGDGRLATALHGYFTEHLGEHRWVTNATPLDDLNADALRHMLGGPARFISVDVAQAPDRLDEILDLAATLVGEGGCIAISDFMHPSQIALTETTIRFLATTPHIAPFAMLPGRLLLAPLAARARYLEMMTAFALHDRTSPLSRRLHQSLARGDGSRLEQTLAGYEMIALA